MADFATQKNLKLFDTVLMELAQASQKALEQGVNFLPINHAVVFMAPYVNNMRHYYNEHYGTSFFIEEAQTTELFTHAKNTRQYIYELHQFVEQEFSSIKSYPNFADEDMLQDLENLLVSFYKQPLEDRFVNVYFLRGILEAATAVAVYRRQSSEAGIAKYIDNSNIVEEIMGLLMHYGIADTSENENSIYSVLCEECGTMLVNKKELNPHQLSQAMIKSLKEYFSFNEEKILSELSPYSELMCRFIDQARKRRQYYQAAVKNLLLFGQDVKFIPHDAAEQMIYLGAIEQNVKVQEDDIFSSSSVPEYLSSYKNTKEFQSVFAQMPYWERYESNADKFNHEKIYHELGKINMFWLGCLYQNMDLIESQLMEIASGKTIDDEENILYKTQAISPQEKEVLDFCKDLVVAMRFSEKYMNISLNNTGLEVDTLDKLARKEFLTLQDINIMGEFIGIVGPHIDESIDIIEACRVPEFENTLNMVMKMPHGTEKLAALTCLNRAVEASLESLSEEMESALFDVDCQLGYATPDNNEPLEDLLQSSASFYPELKKENLVQLAQHIHNGVLAAYVVPAYEREKTVSDQALAATLFIENFDDYTQQTQDCLKNLIKYHADEVMAQQKSSIQNQKISEELQEALDDFHDGGIGLSYMDEMQEEIETALKEEKNFSARYYRYKMQKQKFELPKYFNLMVAAQFYRQSTNR